MFLKIYLFLCALNVLPACVYARVWDPLELELQTSCELLCGCWELNPGPQEKQPVLLTSDLPLQSQLKCFLLSVTEFSWYVAI